MAEVRKGRMKRSVKKVKDESGSGQEELILQKYY